MNKKSNKKIVQFIAVAFLIVAVLFLIPNTEWTKNTSVLGFVSLVCGTLGSVISIFIPTTFTFIFSESDWRRFGERNGFNLIISAKKHGAGRSPQVQTFLKNEMGYEEVEVVLQQDEKGNITINANIKFNGKVIIT